MYQYPNVSNKIDHWTQVSPIRKRKTKYIYIYIYIKREREREGLIKVCLKVRAHINRTCEGIFYWFCFAFSRDSKDFYGNKSKASDKLYFLKKTKLPFIHFSSPSPRKLKNKLPIWNKLNRKQHSTTKQLTKILIKKKSSYKNYSSYKFQVLLEQNQNI